MGVQGEFPNFWKPWYKKYTTWNVLPLQNDESFFIFFFNESINSYFLYSMSLD